LRDALPPSPLSPDPDVEPPDADPAEDDPAAWADGLLTAPPGLPLDVTVEEPADEATEACS